MYTQCAHNVHTMCTQCAHIQCAHIQCAHNVHTMCKQCANNVHTQCVKKGRVRKGRVRSGLTCNSSLCNLSASASSSSSSCVSTLRALASLSVKSRMSPALTVMKLYGVAVLLRARRAAMNASRSVADEKRREMGVPAAARAI